MQKLFWVAKIVYEVSIYSKILFRSFLHFVKVSLFHKKAILSFCTIYWTRPDNTRKKPFLTKQANSKKANKARLLKNNANVAIGKPEWQVCKA